MWRLFWHFVNEQMSAETFAQQLQMTQQVQWPLSNSHARGRRQGLAIVAGLKLDVFLRPGIETRILTEVGVADMRFSLLPDAFMQLTPGTVVNVRAAIPVTQTPGFARSTGAPGIERQLGDPDD